MSSAPVLTRNGHGQGKVTTADGQEAPRPPLSVLCRAHKFFRVADTVFRIPKEKKKFTLSRKVSANEKFRHRDNAEPH